MSEHQQNVSLSGFEGVKVSKGFVRGLQGQVFKLEQIQQNLITQLEHANALAKEFHETSVMYQRKYDEGLRQMEEMKSENGYEKAILNYNLEHAQEELASERELNQVYSEQIEHLERQAAQYVCDMTLQTMQSQATTVANTAYGEYLDYDQDQDQDREQFSPVSVSSPSPRTPRTPRARAQTPTLEHETSETPEAITQLARSFQFQFQCSPAMACCDGLYAPM